MALTAYRKASRWTGWWLGICLLGVAAQIVTLFLMSASGLMDRLGAWAFIPGVLPMLIAMFIGWRVLVRFNRRRLEEVSRKLEVLGLQMTQRPDETAKNGFSASLIHLFPTLGLRNGAASIEWFAVEAGGTEKMRLFEHQFVTGSGKTTQEHHHTIVAWPSGHGHIGDPSLTAAAWFMLGRYPWLLRRTFKDTELKDVAFANLPGSWTFFGNVATGVRFLTPTARSELERAPLGETWCIGAGWVCCSFKGTLDAENMERFLVHARQILAK